MKFKKKAPANADSIDYYIAELMSANIVKLFEELQDHQDFGFQAEANYWPIYLDAIKKFLTYKMRTVFSSLGFLTYGFTTTAIKIKHVYFHS